MCARNAIAEYSRGLDLRTRLSAVLGRASLAKIRPEAPRDERPRQTSRPRDRGTSRTPLVAVSLYGLTLAALAGAVLRVSVRGAAPLAEPHLAVVGDRRRMGGRRGLRRAPAVPPQRALVLAGRHPVRLRAAVRHRRRLPGGALLGAAIAYACRRLPPIKLAFNLAQLALAVCVAVVIVRALAIPATRSHRARTWIAPVRRHARDGRADDRLHRGRDRDHRGRHEPRARCARCSRWTASSPRPTRASRSRRRSLIATDPRAVPVLLVPALIVFGVYRAYVSERQRHEKLEFLYEANRAPVAVARGRRGDRGRARPLARGVPQRDRRGRAVQRGRHAAADDATDPATSA